MNLKEELKNCRELNNLIRESEKDKSVRIYQLEEEIEKLKKIISSQEDMLMIIHTMTKYRAIFYP